MFPQTADATVTFPVPCRQQFVHCQRGFVNGISRLCLIVFTALCSFSSWSQINNTHYRVTVNSEDVVLCGDTEESQSTVNIRSRTAQNNSFAIVFDLPQGVNYVSGSLQVLSQAGSSDYNVSVDETDPGMPLFTIERPGNANWQMDDTVRFRFSKVGDCNALDFLFNGGLFKDAHTISYTTPTGQMTAMDDDPTINSYNFRSPILSVVNYSNSVGIIGVALTKTVEVPNSGTGDATGFIHTVTMDEDLDDAYELAFNGTVLTPNIQGNVYTYSIDLSQAPFSGAVGDFDAIFEEGESIVFEESMVPEAFGTHTITHASEWGCNVTESCRRTNSLSGIVQVASQFPELQITEVSDFTTTDLNAASTYRVRIANVSTDYTAFDVNINSGLSFSSAVFNSSTNTMFGNDLTDATKAIANFRFANVPGTSLTMVRLLNTEFASGAGSYSLPANYDYGSPGTDPDGPGGLEDLDGDGYYDDLGPSSSTELLFDYQNLPRFPVCDSNIRDHVRNLSVRTAAYARSLGGSEIIADPFLLNDAFLKTYPPTIRRPADVFDGDTFTVAIQGPLEVGGKDYQDCNGIPFFSADPNTYWSVMLTVPNGISLDADAGPEYSQTGNTISFTTTALPETLFLNEDVVFPLQYSCGAGISGPIQINYETRYGNACMDELIHCDSFTITASCPDNCDGPSIGTFDARRITAGWTDDAMGTRVSLNETDHALDTYAARDKMLVTATGEIRNIDVDNLYFDMTFGTEEDAGGIDLLNFISADANPSNPLKSQFLIDGVPTNFSLAPVITDEGDRYRMRWDLSSFRSTYASGTQVELMLQFQWNDSFEPDKIYELQNFRGEFYALDSSGSRTRCRVLGDRATYVKALIYTQPNNILLYTQPNSGAAGTGCELAYDENRLSFEVGGNSALFPNEFRPVYILQSTAVDIPIGMSFAGMVRSERLEGNPNSDNGGLDFSVTNNQVILTPGINFLHPGFSGLNTPEFNIQLQLGENTPETGIQSYEATLLEFPYSDNPEVRILRQDKKIRYDPPAFSLNSANPLVDGANSLLSYEVDLCAQAPNNIAFNWLQINHGPSFELSSATEVVSGSEIPLEYTRGTDKSWIRLGAFASGSLCKKVRFYGTFSDCVSLDINIENAWACSGYPADISGYENASYQNSLALRTEAQAATIQLQIEDQPIASVDVCTDFNMAFELRNADSGDLIDPYAIFLVPGNISGMEFNQALVEYPRGSNNIHPVSTRTEGNAFRVNVMEHPTIASQQGIHGASNATSLDGQIAMILIDVSLQCDFTSNTAITYTAFGDQPCGSPATGNGSRLATEPLVITGAEPSYSVSGSILDASGGTLQGCGPHTITVSNLVVGDGPTSSEDIARITLPPGLSVDITSFRATSPLAISDPVVSVVGNHEEIQINMPDGAANNDVITYEFDVFFTTDIESCAPNQTIQIEHYEIGETALSCKGGACPATEISVGNLSTSLVLEKANLVQFGTGSAFYTEGSNGSLEYELSFGLENTSTTTLAAGYTFNAFCTDQDGNKIGPYIRTGTGVQELPARDTVFETLTFSMATPCTNREGFLVELVPSRTNCHCDVLSIPVATEQRFADLELSMSSNGTDANYGDTILFTVQLTNNGPFDARQVTLESLVPPGFTVTNIQDGGEQNENTVVWAGLDLPLNATQAFTFEVTVDFPTALDNDYNIISQVRELRENDPDSTPGNYRNDRPLEDDEAILEINTPPFADLEILKTADVATATYGDTITFTITVNNLGPDIATNISVEDPLPNGFRLVSTETAYGNFTHEMGEWAIPSLEANGTATLILTTEAVQGDNHTNVAFLSFLDQMDLNTENDRDQAIVNVTQNQCLTVYNEFSPNMDGANEVFFIECIEDYPNSLLRIFNRWGAKVYETIGYRNTWTGTSPEGTVLGETENLPVGTYYYTLELRDGSGTTKSGWLYLTR
ncbi:MAG: gliding motility-associated C-terminal domain-containing protein [Bacteroidota bacterium]